MSQIEKDESIFTRFKNFITFVDLPIIKKFMLFFIGVLFWFLLMSVISIATFLDINTRTNRIVNQIIPQDRISQKIIRKLQNLRINADEIVKTSDTRVVMAKLKVSKTRIEDIRTFLLVIISGGQIHDFSRGTDQLIDSFTVESTVGDKELGKYVEELSSLMDNAGKKIEELSELKITALSSDRQDTSQLDTKLGEYQKILSTANALSDGFSARAYKSYAINAKKIKTLIFYSSSIVIAVFIMATVLLVVFTRWITKSIAYPINSIINQMQSLSEGEIDLSKRIVVNSRDEIGTLSSEFNQFMESIHGLARYKKVIDEDENIEDVYSRLGKVFSETAGLHEFIIYEVSNSQNRMKPVSPVILSTKDIFCDEEILSNCDLCRAKKTGHIISSIDYPRMCKQFNPESEKEHVCLPMMVGGSTGGVVQFLFDRLEVINTNRSQIDSKIFRAEKFIKESVSVLEAKRLMNTLRESALKDTLTGLYNRRFLEEYSDTLISGTLRRGKNVGFLMCDVDYFKQVNDAYGHDVGDLVLKETSSVIKKSVRASDLIIRFGGEEFLTLLIDIIEGESIKVAEKIRENMETTKILLRDGILYKTISLGVSEFPIDTENVWQAIKYADVALYKAKDTGRNKAIRFERDMWKEEQY